MVLKSRDFHSNSGRKRNPFSWKSLKLNCKHPECAGVIHLAVALDLESKLLSADCVMTSSSLLMFLSSPFLQTTVSDSLYSFCHNLLIHQGFPDPPPVSLIIYRNSPCQMTFSAVLRLLLRPHSHP